MNEIRSTPRIALFAYNFPHKKTQDFLFYLHSYALTPVCVLAADPIALKIPPSTIRTKLRHCALLQPDMIAQRLGIPYRVVPHAGSEILTLIEKYRPTLGVIAGARILKEPLISSFPAGIINFHPGLLPEVRGLDAMLWSIHRSVPLGVTAHLIDSKVDAGRILMRRTIPLHADDTLIDASERLIETQLELLGPAIETAVEAASGRRVLPHVDASTPYNRKMPAALEQQVAASFGDYLHRILTA